MIWVRGLILLSWYLTAIHVGSSLVLISNSSAHHVCLLRTTHVVSTHHDIVFFDHSYPLHVVVRVALTAWFLLLLGSSMILLCLNNVPSKHLRVLDFNWRVIEDEIVIVDVFYYFDWLLWALLLWFRRSISPLMCSVHIVGRACVIIVLFILELLMTCMAVVTAQLLVSIECLPSVSTSFHDCLVVLLNIVFSRWWICSVIAYILRVLLLVYYFLWVVHTVNLICCAS